MAVLFSHWNGTSESEKKINDELKATIDAYLLKTLKS
jgi:hypothetical protein